MIDFNIIASSSKGNAVVIEKEILIDCGVPFRSIKGVYMDLRFVLLTHEHGDHFNRTTIRKLAQERPMLRFAVPEWLVADTADCGVALQNIDVFTPNLYLSYHKDLSIIMKEIPHNVRNAAWILFINNKSMMYATDCSDLSGIVSKGLDLYLIEANYTEKEITERIRRKQEAGEHVYEWDVLENHLSREQAENWLYQNMGKRSAYVLLHAHEEREVSNDSQSIDYGSYGEARKHYSYGSI
jgi:hypothetical protein